MVQNKWMPDPDQLERIKGELEARHEGEEINYSSCSQNGCFEACVLRTHVKDGKVTAIETDDSLHVGYGREDEYADPEDFRRGLYQRRACTRGRGWRCDNESPSRITYPMKRVGPKPSRDFERISWDEALDIVAKNYLEIREKYGPMSVYADGNMGMSYDYLSMHMPGGAIGAWACDSYEPLSTADELMYGMSQNFDEVAANTLTAQPENQTFLDTECIILWGFDPAINYPENIYYMILAKERGIPVITIDPRYTWSAEVLSTQHIFIRPGTDLAMIIAMCYVMFEEDLVDHEFVDKWVEPVGLEKWRAYVMGTEPDVNEEPKTPEWAEGICGVPAETIRELTRLYASKRPTFMRIVWAAARQHYGKQVAMGFNCLVALGGNLGKNGCAGTSCSFGSKFQTRIPYPAAFYGDQFGQYGFQVNMEAEMWHRAIVLREELEAGKITEEYYKSQVGCPPTKEAPNIHMLLFINVSRNAVCGWYDSNLRIEALKKLDFFVFAHWNFKAPSVAYADVILPLTHPFLEGGVRQATSTIHSGFMTAIAGGCQNFFVQGGGGAKPPEECGYMEWIMHELAKRCGVGDKMFPRVEGHRTHEELFELNKQVCKEAYEYWITDESPMGGKNLDVPRSWEELQKMPVVQIPEDDYNVFMKDNIANDTPLKTKSGKIEFYSELIATSDLTKLVIPKGQMCLGGSGHMPPMGIYRHTPEGMLSPKTNDYPLYMVTPHSFYRQHTAQDENRWFRDEYRASIWISVVDAKARGIKDGDMVHVFNPVGQAIMPAYVTSRMTPGVCCLPFGRWYEPSGVKTETMPDGIDMRGNCNFFIETDFHDDVLGALLSNALCEIEPANAVLEQEKLHVIEKS